MQDTNIGQLAAAIRTTNEPIFSKPIAEISFANQLLNLFNVGRRFNMQVQPSLVLLQKTLFNIEGLGKQLYPDLDLWQTAQPYIQRWIDRHYSPWRFIKEQRQWLPQLIDNAPHLMQKLFDPKPTVAAPKHAATCSPIILLIVGLIAAAMHFEFLLQAPKSLWFIGGVMLSWVCFKLTRKEPS